MALYKQDSSQIPEGAVLMTREQAAEYQRNAIKNHFPQYETYVLRFGSLMLGAAASASGFWFQHFFRKQFLLRHEGAFSTLLPSSFLPGMVSSFGHHEMFAVPIVLQEERCPLCSQVKAGVLQAVSGFAWPLILSPIAALMTVSGHRTFYVPKTYQESFKLALSVTKPGISKMVTLGVLQFVLGIVVTAEEQREFYYMHKRRELRQLETKVVHS